MDWTAISNGLDVYTHRASYHYYDGYQHPTYGPVVVLTSPINSSVYILPQAIWLAMVMSTEGNFDMIRLEDHVDGRAARAPLEYLRRVVTARGPVPPLHNQSPALEDILAVNRSHQETVGFGEGASNEDRHGSARNGDGGLGKRADSGALELKDVDMEDTEAEEEQNHTDPGAAQTQTTGFQTAAPPPTAPPNTSTTITIPSCPAPHGHVIFTVWTQAQTILSTLTAPSTISFGNKPFVAPPGTTKYAVRWRHENKAEGTYSKHGYGRLLVLWICQHYTEFNLHARQTKRVLDLLFPDYLAE
ncbi:hypothetical protein BST61_g11271 [Cercospora zeina]